MGTNQNKDITIMKQKESELVDDLIKDKDMEFKLKPNPGLSLNSIRTTTNNNVNQEKKCSRRLSMLSNLSGESFN